MRGSTYFVERSEPVKLKFASAATGFGGRFCSISHRV